MNLKGKLKELRYSLRNIRQLEEETSLLKDEVILLKNELRSEKLRNDRLERHLREQERLIRYNYYSLLTPEQYPAELEKLYYTMTKKRLDLENPRTFNEKIQWFKIFGVTSQTRELADKYRVRSFVSSRIGKNYLIPLLGVWNHPEEIDFSSLPEKFVIKANHGSQYNYIVHDKTAMDVDDFIRTANKWLAEDFAFRTLELQYHGIQRCLLAEELLENDNGEDIYDYKFLCFDGTPEYFWVDVDRYGDHRRNIYDMDGNLQNWTLEYENTNTVIQRPDKWNEMVDVAKKLSKGFPHVRVDLYYAKGKVYFGELTFTSSSGFAQFTPPDADYKLGALWDIQNYKYTEPSYQSDVCNVIES